MSDWIAATRARVVDAAATHTPLCICGASSKRFYGREPQGSELCTREHRGIVSYEPTELVVTARAGTPLDALIGELDSARQMLAFEPPAFGAQGTVGGAIASGLAGPRRPYAGAVRDFVLGIQCINGRGDVLTFGGQVMKNVAGYDISRLMTVALGTLGVITQVSLKVLPKPLTETTLRLEIHVELALEKLTEYARQPLPISGASYESGVLRIRLSGTENGVNAARKAIGGDIDAEGAHYWIGLRDQTLAFFKDDTPLWRLSVPPSTPALSIGNDQLVDWGGALRWVKTEASATEVRSTVAVCGGHATLFRGGDRKGEVFQPLPPVLMGWHQRLKRAFDPNGILNPGRLYADMLP